MRMGFPSKKKITSEDGIIHTFLTLLNMPLKFLCFYAGNYDFLSKVFSDVSFCPRQSSVESSRVGVGTDLDFLCNFVAF